MSPALLLTDHLTRLTDSLTTLKDRVREAVVGELSRIASDTLSEVIRTLLGPARSTAFAPFGMPASTTRGTTTNTMTAMKVNRRRRPSPRNPSFARGWAGWPPPAACCSPA